MPPFWSDMGELSNAAFCGSADGNGRLAVAVGSTANIAVFTPDYGSLPIAGSGASDWSIVTPVVAVPSSCDSTSPSCNITVTQSAAPKSA